MVPGDKFSKWKALDILNDLLFVKVFHGGPEVGHTRC